MYLHLGQDALVKTSDVIGIFDLDNTTVSKNTRDFLARAEKKGRVVNVAADLPDLLLDIEKKNRLCGDHLQPRPPACGFRHRAKVAAWGQEKIRL